MARAREMRAILVVLAIAALVCPAHSQLFKDLKKSLIVSANFSGDGATKEYKAGEDRIFVAWKLNATADAEGEATYSKASVKLCYAPVSQKDRKWRKTYPDLAKDKTCAHKMYQTNFSANSGDPAGWLIRKDVPFATYFIRVYALHSNGTIVAFGQTTNVNKTTNLFQVIPITGRHVSIDIAVACFSAFSIGSLAAFFVFDQMRSKKNA